MQKILITAALPYANGPLHFGHIAGVYLPGDCYARFQRLLKNDVLYISGSDEYGIAITLSAELAGRTPKEHVEFFHKQILAFFQKLNLSFDHFSRTTCHYHEKPVQEFFLELMENGYIEAKVTDQLYSEDDQRFLADRYVVGECAKCSFPNARGDECPKCAASYDATDLKNPRSKLTNAPLVLRKTKHWFLLLDKFIDKLQTWMETKNWKPNVINFAKGFVYELHPRSITRDSDWGIPVPLPDAKGKVLYVWFDAPIGYLSATMEWADQQGNPDLWKKYWCEEDTKLVHFIGKDNIPFHAVIFPAMIMGQNQPYKLVDEIPANEFYKLEGSQFSKSEGWYIDLEDFFQKYSTDQIRYMLAATAPEVSDSEFTWKEFQLRCNGELLGKYGNLVNRVMIFALKHCDGKIPKKSELEEIDRNFLQEVKRIAQEIKESYANFRLRRASQLVMELAQAGNVYFDGKKPWIDAKDPKASFRMETTLSCCIECLRILALTSYPMIPETAGRIWKMLGFNSLLEEETWDLFIERELPYDQPLNEPKILFTKIEDSQIEQEIQKLKFMSQKQQSINHYEQALKSQIGFELFDQLDLRVGEVIQVEEIPKSKKLYKIKIDLGFEARTVVSGIREHYEPKSLIGKKVVVVANLKPAKLMGVESHGMILAGSNGENLEILEVQHLPKGSVVS